MNKHRFRRKKSLVDRQLQFGFAGILFGYLILYTLFLIVMMGIPIWWIVHNTAGGEFARMAAVGRFVIDDHRFWFLLSIFIVVISFHSIMVTRKIAGPIFVFRRHLKRALNGELARIHLRQNDYFQDIRELLNDFFDKTVDCAVKNRKVSEAIREKLSLLERSLQSQTDSPEKIKELIKEAKVEIGTLEELNKNHWNYSD